jgi:hypothetical protein
MQDDAVWVVDVDLEAFFDRVQHDAAGAPTRPATVAYFAVGEPNQAVSASGSPTSSPSPTQAT